MIKNLKDIENLDVNKLTESMQKSTKLMIWTGGIVGVIGLCLVAYHNWVIAIGVFIAMWGNNLEQNGRRAKNDLQKQAIKMFGLDGMFGQQNPKDN